MQSVIAVHGQERTILLRGGNWGSVGAVVTRSTRARENNIVERRKLR